MECVKNEYFEIKCGHSTCGETRKLKAFLNGKIDRSDWRMPSGMLTLSIKETEKKSSDSEPEVCLLTSFKLKFCY